MSYLKVLGVNIAVLFLVACGVNQPLENAISISPGMTKGDVLDIMGSPPVSNDFYGNLEEWHFCNTGMTGVSKYVAVFFKEGRVFSMKRYSVVERDAGGDAFAVCENFVKKGDYREPDEVREYRIR